MIGCPDYTSLAHLSNLELNFGSVPVKEKINCNVEV